LQILSLSGEDATTPFVSIERSVYTKHILSYFYAVKRTMTTQPIIQYSEPIQPQLEEIVVQLEIADGKPGVVPLPQRFPRSPLRYPGGKTRAVKLLYSYIPADETKLCSPFLGGASLELACTTRMQVCGADIFEPLIAFWNALLHRKEELIERVTRYYPLSRSNFYSLQKSYTDLTDELERAAAFFVLNRCSFSGTTLSGGMSPGHPRFTLSAIERLKSFTVRNFDVECSDYREFIPKHDDAFLYLDPPYMIDQALYGVNGSTHKEFNHLELAKLLRKRDRWIMSYNDCYEIRKLYQGCTILSLEWIYGMARNKQSNEILILSEDLNS